MIESFLPQLTLCIAACVLCLFGRLVRTRGLSGYICLGAIAVAGWELSVIDTRTYAGESLLGQETLSFWYQCWMLAMGGLISLNSIGVRNDSRYAAENSAMLLLGMSAAMTVPMSNDLVVLFLVTELLGLTTLLIPICSPGSREGAVRQFKMGLVPSAMFLMGCVLIYAVVGSTNLETISQVLRVSYQPADPSLAVGSASRLGVAGSLLIFAGLGARMVLIPFYVYSSDAFDDVSNWSLPQIVVLQKSAAFIALIIVTSSIFSGAGDSLQRLTLVVAALTMLVGGMMALFQNRIRKVLAYTTLADGGFLLVGVVVDLCHAQAQSLIDGGGVPTALFAMTVYSLGIIGFSAVIMYLTPPKGQLEYIAELSGIFRREPVIAVCSFVLLLSLAGLPPLGGFWGRFFLLSSALSVRLESTLTQFPTLHGGLMLLVLVCVLYCTAMAAVYLRIAVVALQHRQISRPYRGGGPPALIAALLASLACLAVGIQPDRLLNQVADVDGTPNVAASDHRTDAVTVNDHLNSSARSERLKSQVSKRPIPQTKDQSLASRHIW